MRNGIYSLYIRSNETTTKGIALVEHDAIRGVTRNYVYFVERLVNYPAERLRMHRKHWRAYETEYLPAQAISMHGFPAKLDGEDDEDQFLFEGESDVDSHVRVEIQGAWLHDLPWNRVVPHKKQK